MIDENHEPICIKELLEKYGQEPRCGCPKCEQEQESIAKQEETTQ
jgi:hypothetical protein